MIEIERNGPIFDVKLVGDENKLTLSFLRAFDAKLDEVVETAGDGPAAVMISADGKFWSTGIDLDWLQSAPVEEQGAFLPALNGLLGRLVSFPLPTAAALNGHAFAGGALLALATDYRVMRADRGWFCYPEIDIQVPFAPPMIELLKAKLSPNVLRDAVLTGRRYTAAEALAAGIIDKACSLEQLRTETSALLTPLAEKARAAYDKFKRDLYGDLAASFGYEGEKA